ncbi:MAG: hypothetical protein MUE42_04595 [Opitutaceae bacterium]|jgi:hypothetical protein|nr:hypothetical protein [Opitutaceae bacterium]
MAANAPQTPAGDDRNLVTVDENYLAPTFEDRLQMFWEKHSRTIVALVVLVTVVLVGRWAFDLFAERREQAIRAEYAAAGTSAQLQAFITSHPKAALAGVAALRLADEAYAAGNYADAGTQYAAAIPLLGTDPLAARAKVGAALSPLMAGDTAAAKTALESLANDTALVAAARAESAYHLAVLARDGGQIEEANKWAALVLSVDPESVWSQRAMQLRAALPVVSASPATAAGEASAEGASIAFPAAK